MLRSVSDRPLAAAQASQHADPSPAPGPAQPLHRGPAAPGCVRPDRVLSSDVSADTCESWSAGERLAPSHGSADPLLSSPHLSSHLTSPRLTSPPLRLSH